MTAYACCTDITKCVTPDIKHVGVGHLLLFDLIPGKCRMGGSALSTVYSQIGDEAADMDDPEALKRMFNLIQLLVHEQLISAGHDRSDGGTVVTILEMAFSGNCGLNITLPSNNDTWGALFGEELGILHI